jgi:hypothetical protein
MKEFKEYEEFKEGKLFGRMSAGYSGHARWMKSLDPVSQDFPTGFSGGLPEGPDAVNLTSK